MIAFTVVSRAQIAHARVLARSFRQHHPRNEFWALVIDDLSCTLGLSGEPFQVLTLADLAIDTDEVRRMAMLFGSRLGAALKPWALERLQDRRNGPVIYLDPDVMVYDGLGPLEEAATEGIALVPHVLRPLPRDGQDPDETRVLGVGLYDAGTLGVAMDRRDFVQFLQERLRRECVFDVAKMRANEQRWLDFVPSLFPYRVVRDTGVDVAYWNLHERPLSRDGQTLLAGGSRLRSFHFSTFDPRLEDVAGRFEIRGRPRTSRAADPLFSELCRDYGRRLLEAGFEEARRAPSPFGSLPDGTPIYDSLRALYANSLAAAESGAGPRPPDPFDPSTVEEFREWATQAYQRVGLPLPWRLRVQPTTSAEAADLGPPNAPLPKGRARVGHRVRQLRGLSGVAWANARRSIGGPEANTDSGSPDRAAGQSPTDWLGTLDTGPAGARSSAPARPIGFVQEWLPPTIDVTPTRVGLIALGRGNPLDPATYQASVELFPIRPPDGLSPLDQAFVAEAFLDGYVLGYRTATFDDIANGPVLVDFTVPEHLGPAALLGGVELRLASRGIVHATLGAVLVQRLGPAVELPNAGRSEWLPVMTAGTAGRRAGTEVNALPGVSGVVVQGPFWRLPAGRYVARLRTRPFVAEAEASRDPNGPVAVLDVVAGDAILAEQLLSVAHLSGSRVALTFDVSASDAGPGTHIGLRLRTEAAAGFAVEELSVEPVPT